MIDSINLLIWTIFVKSLEVICKKCRMYSTHKVLCYSSRFGREPKVYVDFWSCEPKAEGLFLSLSTTYMWKWLEISCSLFRVYKVLQSAKVDLDFWHVWLKGFQLSSTGYMWSLKVIRQKLSLHHAHMENARQTHMHARQHKMLFQGITSVSFTRETLFSQASALWPL